MSRLARTGDQAGATWTWGPHEWGWTPTQQPLGQSLSAAPRYGRLAVTTADIPPAERYEFWRRIVWPDWDGDQPTAAQRRDFRANAEGLFCGPRTLVLFESDSTSGGRAKPPPSEQGGALHFGLVLAGERRSETAGDRPHRAQAGDLYAYDPDRDAKVAWPRRHRGVNLMIPRDALIQIFGADLPLPSELLASLSRSALAPLVAAQFRLLAQQSPHFNDLEAEAALGGTIEFILAALRSGRSPTVIEDAMAGDTALVVAARRYIEIHFGERDLDAPRLAAALGCSRATLYRALALRDLTVGDAIRDVRLGRFRELLRYGPDSESVAAVAARCGLDARSARRLFKAAYGLSPQDFRASHNRPRRGSGPAIAAAKSSREMQ